MSLRRLVAVLLALALARAATADPLTPSARRKAEDAFVVGRYDLLDDALAEGTDPIDVEPRAVLDLFWRPRTEVGGTQPWFQVAPDTDASLSARRIRWLQAWGGWYGGRRSSRWEEPYPLPAGPGETDPFPRITALVLERLRRESEGARGLPEASPVAAVFDPTLDAFASDVMRPAYQGLRPEDRSPEERDAEARLDARIRATVSRNRTLAIVSIGVLVLGAIGACAGLTKLVVRVRRRAASDS